MYSWLVVRQNIDRYIIARYEKQYTGAKYQYPFFFAFFLHFYALFMKLEERKNSVWTMIKTEVHLVHYSIIFFLQRSLVYQATQMESMPWARPPKRTSVNLRRCWKRSFALMRVQSITLACWSPCFKTSASQVSPPPRLFVWSVGVHVYTAPLHHIAHITLWTCVTHMPM